MKLLFSLADRCQNQSDVLLNIYLRKLLLAWNINQIELSLDFSQSDRGFLPDEHNNSSTDSIQITNRTEADVLEKGKSQCGRGLLKSWDKKILSVFMAQRLFLSKIWQGFDLS